MKTKVATVITNDNTSKPIYFFLFIITTTSSSPVSSLICSVSYSPASVSGSSTGHSVILVMTSYELTLNFGVVTNPFTWKNTVLPSRASNTKVLWTPMTSSASLASLMLVPFITVTVTP